MSYEAVRLWCHKFGPSYSSALRKRRGRLGDSWFLDEATAVTIHGQRLYLWRAVDQDNDVIDVLVQKRKDKQAAKRFFLKMLKHQGATPRRITTDRLRSCGSRRVDARRVIAGRGRRVWHAGPLQTKGDPARPPLELPVVILVVPSSL